MACTRWQPYLLLRRPLRIVPLRLNLTPGYLGELPVGALPQVLMHLLCQITLLRRASKCKFIAAVITEDAGPMIWLHAEMMQPSCTCRQAQESLHSSSACGAEGLHHFTAAVPGKQSYAALQKQKGDTHLLGNHPDHKLLGEQHVVIHGLCCCGCNLRVLELQEGIVLRLPCLLVSGYSHIRDLSKLREETCRTGAVGEHTKLSIWCRANALGWGAFASGLRKLLKA